VAGGRQVNERLAQENKLLRTGMARLEELMASNEQRVRNHTLEDIDRLLQDREVTTLSASASAVLRCVGILTAGRAGMEKTARRRGGRRLGASIESGGSPCACWSVCRRVVSGGLERRLRCVHELTSLVWRTGDE
jgi:hypothetical protein